MTFGGKKREAGGDVMGLAMANLWGWKISGAPIDRVINNIVYELSKKDYVKPYFVVTAYSETFLETEKNPEFKKAIAGADLVLADGVSLRAAMDFNRHRTGDLAGDFFRGLQVGRDILSGKYRGGTTGVELMRQLIKLSGKKRLKVFMLGGWGGVAGRLVKRLTINDSRLTIDWEGGPEKIEMEKEIENSRIMDRINKFRPDLLFVSFGRFKQEVWIANNLVKLKTKVVMGVGSSFDELAGEGTWPHPVPGWVEKRGLKWLWRVGKDPKHLRRAWNAFPVFAWKVFTKK